MVAILGFNDLGCLNESAAGSLGSGLAVFARAGFATARGFVVTPVVFTDYLKKDEVEAAMDLYRTGAEDPAESWRAVKDIFRRARMGWAHEMDIITAFKELDSTVSIVTTTRFGTGAAPVYAASGEDLLDGIKHCWLKWLKDNMAKLDRADPPAVLVRAVLDSEATVELKKKGPGIRARAVFGLPEGLGDPSVSSDIFEFGADGGLERLEQREQLHQYVMKAQGPAKVDVAPEFSKEEKVSGETLASLRELMIFMTESSGVGGCTACIISGRPVVYAASLMSESPASAELPARDRSMSLLAPEPAPVHVPAPQPVVATRLFLNVDDPAGLNALGESYVEGVLVTGRPLREKKDLARLSSEAGRRFRTSRVIIEIEDASQETLKELASALESIEKAGQTAGILIPGIRSEEELARTVKSLVAASGDSKPEIWVRIMYPSNLYFMEALARHADVMAVDLDTLGRLMLGGGEDGRWLNFSIPALEKALEEAFRCSGKALAVISHDLVSTPSLLEFLIRRGAHILCVRPGDLHTVRHIAASVEKRMLLEQGKASGGE